MSMKLDSADLVFLERLERTPEGQYLLDLLRRKLAHWDARLRVATGEELIRSQGKAQALVELISDIEKARKDRNRPANLPVQNLTARGI